MAQGGEDPLPPALPPGGAEELGRDPRLRGAAPGAAQRLLPADRPHHGDAAEGAEDEGGAGDRAPERLQQDADQELHPDHGRQRARRGQRHRRAVADEQRPDHRPGGEHATRAPRTGLWWSTGGQRPVPPQPHRGRVATVAKLAVREVLGALARARAIGRPGQPGRLTLAVRLGPGRRADGRGGHSSGGQARQPVTFRTRVRRRRLPRRSTMPLNCSGPPPIPPCPRPASGLGGHSLPSAARSLDSGEEHAAPRRIRSGPGSKPQAVGQSIAPVAHACFAFRVLFACLHGCLARSHHTFID
mmetsp:Transcript_44125/g.137388  ORF Transcript_44125/g.137388 Transcript_44125/m.137388 type:complete len:301 (-) Transcript_44125:147-1049(-)